MEMSVRYLIALSAALAIGDLSPSPVRAAPIQQAAEQRPVSEADFTLAADRIIAMLEATTTVPGASPASAVVMVQRGQAPRIWVDGRLAVDRPDRADGDTPFYVASQTKPFVGLMAVALDARGVFDLDWTMADVWPDLVLPRGADARTITFRELLSHQAPIENDALSFRTSFTDDVPSSDYGRLLAGASRARAPGYSYSNLGYLIYGAALELKTGRHWRDWISDVLFSPLGMQNSGPSSSRYDPALLPAYHRWSGVGDSWSIQPVKTDGLMHAAGGLNVSPNDMARWLTLQLGGVGGPDVEGIVRASHVIQVRGSQRNDAVQCQAYSIGWMVCRVGAVDVLFHGGSYTGVRGAMAVSPELGVAIAYMSNSDSLTGGLGQRTLLAFLEGVQNPDSLPTAEAAAADYTRRMAASARARVQAGAADQSDRRWSGWTWTPPLSDRATYVGRYRNPFYGDLEITERGDGLDARIGVLNRPLRPASADLFALVDGPINRLEPIAFQRRDGRIAALTWNDQQFDRVD